METNYNKLLYEKMQAENETFKDWLLSQEPAEILNHNPAIICRTICCIFRFFLIVITNKYDIMIGQRLNDQLFIQTFIDDFIINATPKKILCNDITGWTFLW